MPNIKEILADEREARKALRSEDILWQGENVNVSYPELDINEIQAAFDGDPTSLIRSLEANPLKLIVTFSEKTPINSVTLKIGGTPTHITLSAVSDGHQLEKIAREVGSSPTTRDITLKFGNT
ncbi:MAG TPA: hypothetical protein VIM80_04135, partial [Brevefilum sp.]